MIFVTTGALLYGAAQALLATPVARWLNSARNEDPALLRALRLAIGVLTLVSILAVSTGSLGLVFAATAALNATLMDTTLEVGSLSVRSIPLRPQSSSSSRR